MHNDIFNCTILFFAYDEKVKSMMLIFDAILFIVSKQLIFLSAISYQLNVACV